MEDKNLLHLDKAKRELALVTDVRDAKKIRDMAEAYRYAAKEAKAGLEVQNKAAEIKIRAERRAGELLAGMAEAGERDKGMGGDRKSQLQAATVKLGDLGIEKTQSHRWQAIATIPEKSFEAEIAKAKDAKQELTSSGLYRFARKAGRQDRAGAPALPKGKYRVIYADPPWRYQFCESESRSIEKEYPTMALEEICALPVADIAGDDSILFLWATSPKVGEALQVLEAWEFTYKTCLVWVKDKIGMGYWFRQQHEQLLLGTKGSPPTPETENRMSSVIDARRSKKHSEKPIAFYELIESMYPEYREREKIELFQRIPREGWAGWGNEVTENGSA